jgi:hypothetical protein
MNTKTTLLHKIWFLALTAGLLVGLLWFTNPDRLPLYFLILPFVLIGCVVYLLVSIAVTVTGRRLRGGAKLLPISLAFFVVLTLLLESLHQLTWKDTLIALSFIGLFWLYVWRADFLK